jgi:hypothetical protein
MIDLLPTSKTKDVTSNIPCSFNDPLEICHPWLWIFLKLFLFLVNRTFLCNEFNDFTIFHLNPVTWVSQRDWLHHPHQHMNVSTCLPSFWALLAELEAPGNDCNPLHSQTLYNRFPILCHSLLFVLKKFNLKNSLGIHLNQRIQTKSRQLQFVLFCFISCMCVWGGRVRII